ncbi:ABC transporter ATP-binding protein [Paenibacillus puerhi]|uniref:ABC transporter ATP-binding protein n=1 Tax=Paenibacillus puerhi TaxID=2692622 RepID=UPI001F38242D|nr:ABC transporter ATP-binding protein [Paenibacillus puerhi]
MTTRSTVFRRLIRYVRPYSHWVAMTVAASLAVAAIEIVLGKFLERMVQSGDQTPGEIVLLIAGMILIGMPCRYLIKYASAQFSVRALRDMRNELVRRIGDLPLPSVERKLTGDLISRLTQDTGILQTFFIQHFANLFYLPVVFTGALIILLLTSWKLVLSSLVLLPLGMVVAGLLTNSMQSISEQVQTKFGRLSAMAQDSIAGLSVIKACNAQALFVERYSSLMREAVQQSLRLEKRYAALGPIAILCLTAPVVFVIVYGGHLITLGELNAGGIILFLYLLAFVLQPVGSAPELMARIQEASGAARRLFEALDWPTERQGENRHQAGPDSVPVLLHNLTFSYDGEHKVLDGISFQLHREETLAIVGASGGGKSTLFKLLCGFYEPGETDGTLQVFGRPLADWNLAELRTQISVVSQESYLFPATVAENIGYGRLDATRDEIVAAARAANAHDFIMQLPEGYETVLGERGGNLSGGQKQRIAVARAFLKKAPLLLLDEPTSALDTVSEAYVQAALKQLMAGRSVIVIAHRLSTVLQADRILVFDQGKIAESGTHEQLMRMDGVYKKLYAYQLAKEPEPETDKDKDVRERGASVVLEAGIL